MNKVLSTIQILNRTITLSESESGMVFATSEDEPPIFIAHFNRESVEKILSHTLSQENNTHG